MAQVLDWQSLSALSPLLAALPERARAPSRLRQLDPGSLLFMRGDVPRSMFFVVSGEIRLVRKSEAGGEIMLQRAKRGFIAEASLDQQGYHCDAVAAVASDVVAIPRRAFNGALNEESFRTQWIAHLARELRRVRAHSERLCLRSARERIIHFIEVEGENGCVSLTQTKKDWAAELGLTHEALYRALSQMQKDGKLAISQMVVRLVR